MTRSTPIATLDYRTPLREVFGFEDFRQGQEEVVQQLLADRPALAIFPTGAGKSLCYQLPALLLDGLTLVISPLIALMKDQVDFLCSRHIAAARLDSSLDWPGVQKVLRDLTTGKLKILYIAPERLASERFLQTLKRLKIALLAIDEAHCISEWGHNFRPDYLKLARLAQDLKIRRVLALTATATPAVAEDIARSFNIAAESIIHTGFYRPNLTLHVTPCRTGDKLRLLQQRLMTRPRGTTIVYVTLQRTAEMVATVLADAGMPARHYHAGMEAAERETVQNWFMSDPTAIVVATIAFGMGIDKANIRAIYHYNLPKSLENYTQEIGRAGRDGLPAVCELFATSTDRLVLENFIYGDTPDPSAIAAVLEELFRLPREFDVSVYEISGKHDIRPLVLETLLTYLELQGILESTGPFYSEYQFQPLRPSQEILARFDKARAEFLGRVFRQAQKGKTWFTMDVTEAAEKLHEPRSRLVAALTYLEEQGHLILRTTGARQGYRRQDLTKHQRQQLAEELAERFLHREQRDLERLHLVLDYTEHPGCATAYLLHYFGDNSLTACGHCSRCLGEPAQPLPPEPEADLSPIEDRLLAQLRRENHPALATPRQLARFLCGLNSPAATRAKLPRDKRFGTLSHHPFLNVLEWIQGHFETE